MLGAHARRGLAAGLLAGLLAGLFALAVAQPQMDAAIAWEEAAGGAPDHDAEAFSRPAQKAGMVAGLALTGLAVGAVFGVAAAWAAGRVAGDAWQRSLKLGAAVVGAVVLLPALQYPPNPPGVGDPEAVGTRSLLYLALAGAGLVIVAAASAGARALVRTDLPAPLRTVSVAAGVVAAATVLLVALPPIGTAGEFPADLLWTFRLSSIGTQAALYAGTAVIFGLLSVRAAPEGHAARVLR